MFVGILISPFFYTIDTISCTLCFDHLQIYPSNQIATIESIFIPWVCVCMCLQLINYLAIYCICILMNINFISQSFIFTNNVTHTQRNLQMCFYKMFFEVNLPGIFIEMALLRQRVNTVTSFLDITKVIPCTSFINLHPYQQYIRVPENFLPAQCFQSFGVFFLVVFICVFFFANLICER